MTASQSLDDYKYLIGMIARRTLEQPDAYNAFAKLGKMYCPVCLENVTMNVHQRTHVNGLLSELLRPVIEKMLPRRESKEADRTPHSSTNPSLLLYTCIHCDSEFTVLLYMSPEGPALAVFAKRSGSIASAHTPEKVAYFLSEAHKIRSVGAYGAAISMLRSALDELLEDQGFHGRELADKILKLQEAKNALRAIPVDSKELVGEIPEPREEKVASTIPMWVEEIDTPEMTSIQRIGDTTSHGNDCKMLTTLTSQDALVAEQLLLHLAEIIYEQPLRDAEVESILQSALNSIKTNLLVPVKVE